MSIIFNFNIPLIYSEFATNLSNETLFLPITKDYNRENKRKFALIDLAALKKKSFTHVILRVQPSSLPVSHHFIIIIIIICIFLRNTH